MTIAEFRKNVKTAFPHVTVSVRTVSFMDLARMTAKCLTVTGNRTLEELKQINEWAREASIVRDGSLRAYGQPE